MIGRPGLLRQACAVNPHKIMIKSAAFSSFRSGIKTPVSPRLRKPTFVRNTPASSMNIAVFHSSARKDILPPRPQEIEGTANEAAHVPEPHSLEGAYHWTFERAVAVALIPITIAPFVGTSMNPVLDATFCGLLVLHSHMGFSSAITDYFPRKRVPKTRKAFEYSLLAGTVLVAYGLWEFETNDVGLVEGVKRVWKA